MDDKKKIFLQNEDGYVFLKLSEPQLRLLDFLSKEGYLDAEVFSVDNMPYEEV